MITHIPYDALGRVRHGWLDARHHFSFGRYYNPNRMGFGPLRVVNDDLIGAKSGFDPHPHDNMEIITYVRQGAITHRDNRGNEGRTGAGDVQVMSAGTGIVHAEYNLEDETTNLYQIWIEPREQGVAPRWDQKAFPKTPVTSALPLLVSGDDDAPLYIHSDARMYGGRLDAGVSIEHPVQGMAYVLASDGAFSVNGQSLARGDALEVVDEPMLTISATEDSEIVVLDVPSPTASA